MEHVKLNKNRHQVGGGNITSAQIDTDAQPIHMPLQQLLQRKSTRQ